MICKCNQDMTTIKDKMPTLIYYCMHCGRAFLINHDNGETEWLEHDRIGGKKKDVPLPDSNNEIILKKLFKQLIDEI